MLTRKMMSLLSCPSCRGLLVPQTVEASGGDMVEGALVCASPDCGGVFPVRNGIPDLMPGQLLDQQEWKHWKEHLDGFQKRRDLRITDANSLASRLVQKKKGVQQAFGRFIDIKQGVVLDVGCGPGKLRLTFDPDKVEYYGVDPTPLPECTEFPYARAVAEYLPFKDGTFTDVVVVSALDHFRDTTGFFNEVKRVLTPDGRLHVVQTVHKPRNPIKLAAHMVKDALEDRATKDVKGHAPHHMWEFSKSSFLNTVSASFRTVGQTVYKRNWYSPDKLFLTLTPQP